MNPFAEQLKKHRAEIETLLKASEVSYHFEPQSIEQKYEALKTEADEMRRIAERTLWMCQALIAGDEAMLNEAVKIQRENVAEIVRLESALDEAHTAMEWALEVMPPDAWERKYVNQSIETAKAIKAERDKKLGLVMHATTEGQTQ